VSVKWLPVSVRTNVSVSTERQKLGAGEELSAAYCNPWEHLADELRLFDARVYLATLRRKERNGGLPADPLRSVIIGDQEIERAVEQLAGGWDDNAETFEDDEAASVRELLLRLQERIWDRRILSKSASVRLPLPRLTEAFGLNRFEELCLVMCMAADLDRRYERLFGYLQDDLTRNRPSIDLFFYLLDLTVSERVGARKWFSSDGPLLRHRLIRVTTPPGDPDAPFINRFLQIDERVASFLVGLEVIDARIDNLASITCAQGETECELPPDVEELVKYVGIHFRTRACAPLAVCLFGPDGCKKESAAAAICKGAAKTLIRVRAESLPEGAAGQDLLALLHRETKLTNGALFFQDPLANFVDPSAGQQGRLTIFSSLEKLPSSVAPGAQFLFSEMSLPDASARLLIWQTKLGSLNVAAGIDLLALASQFCLTETQIQMALEQALAHARHRHPERPMLTAADISAACREQATARLGSLARQIVPCQNWNDLVLPQQQMDQLREICERARFGQVVYNEWGFANSSTLGKGVNALFTGSPGTGKTMSAELIAGELGQELYKIDLSQVVSKYVGETEKNLSCVFREAQGSNAILFFDECDALFGKRSEVKDAHDRYANIEIGFLLQRMEEYSGVSIMATNLRRNLDEAFVRRLHFIVEFPMPDEANRLMIWQKNIPDRAPTEILDLEFLAKQFPLSGGSIRNIAVSAAFRSAAEGGALGMHHLAAATRREFEKMGRTCASSEFGPYAAPVSSDRESVKL
jgi:AAA+ superfamily predicted ATPase